MLYVKNVVIRCSRILIQMSASTATTGSMGARNASLTERDAMSVNQDTSSTLTMKVMAGVKDVKLLFHIVDYVMVPLYVKLVNLDSRILDFFVFEYYINL